MSQQQASPTNISNQSVNMSSQTSPENSPVRSPSLPSGPGIPHHLSPSTAHPFLNSTLQPLTTAPTGMLSLPAGFNSQYTLPQACPQTSQQFLSVPQQPRKTVPIGALSLPTASGASYDSLNHPMYTSQESLDIPIEGHKTTPTNTSPPSSGQGFHTRSVNHLKDYTNVSKYAIPAISSHQPRTMAKIMENHPTSPPNMVNGITQVPTPQKGGRTEESPGVAQQNLHHQVTSANTTGANLGISKATSVRMTEKSISAQSNASQFSQLSTVFTPNASTPISVASSAFSPSSNFVHIADTESPDVDNSVTGLSKRLMNQLHPELQMSATSQDQPKAFRKPMSRQSLRRGAILQVYCSETYEETSNAMKSTDSPETQAQLYTAKIRGLYEYYKTAFDKHEALRPEALRLQSQGNPGSRPTSDPHAGYPALPYGPNSILVEEACIPLDRDYVISLLQTYRNVLGIKHPELIEESPSTILLPLDQFPDRYLVQQYPATSSLEEYKAQVSPPVTAGSLTPATSPFIKDVSNYTKSPSPSRKVAGSGGKSENETISQGLLMPVSSPGFSANRKAGPTESAEFFQPSPSTEQSESGKRHKTFSQNASQTSVTAIDEVEQLEKKRQQEAMIRMLSEIGRYGGGAPPRGPLSDDQYVALISGRASLPNEPRWKKYREFVSQQQKLRAFLKVGGQLPEGIKLWQPQNFPSTAQRPHPAVPAPGQSTQQPAQRRAAPQMKQSAANATLNGCSNTTNTEKSGRQMINEQQKQYMAQVKAVQGNLPSVETTEAPFAAPRFGSVGRNEQAYVPAPTRMFFPRETQKQQQLVGLSLNSQSRSPSSIRVQRLQNLPTEQSYYPVNSITPSPNNLAHAPALPQPNQRSQCVPDPRRVHQTHAGTAKWQQTDASQQQGVSSPDPQHISSKLAFGMGRISTPKMTSNGISSHIFQQPQHVQGHMQPDNSKSGVMYGVQEVSTVAPVQDQNQANMEHRNNAQMIYRDQRLQTFYQQQQLAMLNGAGGTALFNAAQFMARSAAVPQYGPGMNDSQARFPQQGNNLLYPSQNMGVYISEHTYAPQPQYYTAIQGQCYPPTCAPNGSPEPSQHNIQYQIPYTNGDVSATTASTPQSYCNPMQQGMQQPQQVANSKRSFEQYEDPEEEQVEAVQAKRKRI